MTRRAIVWFAVVAAALVVLASAASAATAVASSNTTASDFEAASELSTAAVVGSGTDASVALRSADTVDSFEDGDLAEYTGDTADFDANSNDPVFDGSQSLKTTGSTFSRIFSTSGLPTYPQQGDVFGVDVQADSDADTGAIIFGVQDSNNYYQLSLEKGSDDITLFAVDGGSFDEVASASADYPGGEQLTVLVDWQTDGTIDVSVLDPTGAEVASLSASDSTYASGGIGFGGASGWTFDHYRIQTQGGGTYVSSTHSVSDAETGWTNLTLQNAEASVEWRTDDDDDGTFETVVNSTSHTTSGNKTLALDAAPDDYRVNVTFTSQSGPTVARLHDEGVLFDASSPALSDFDPPDGAEVSDYGGNVSVDVSDPDFGTSQGDSVDVTVSNESGEIGSETVTSNGTVTIAYDALAGENNLDWEASDSYSATSDTTETQTFHTPAELLIRNETSPTEAVTTDGSAEVTFFGEQEIETRPIEDGSADMSGLPADETFVAVIDVDGYYQRRILIPSLFEQQRAFLLNDTMTAVDVEFYLDDSTGQFSSGNVELTVDKAIEINNSTEFRTVVGDRISAAGELPATLEQGSRYRLTVSNEDGVTRSLGSWTATSSGPVELPIGRIELSGESDEGWLLEHSIDEDADTNHDGVLRLKYLDQEGTTDSIETEVVRLDDEGNETETVLENATETGTQSVVRSVEINNTTDTFVVKYRIERGDEVFTGERKLGAVQGIGLPMDDGWLNLISWVGVFAFGGLVVIKDSRAAGVVMAGSASLFAMLGWLNAPTAVLGLATAGAVVWVVAGYGGRF